VSVNVVLKSVFDDKGIKQAQREFGNLSGKLTGLATALGAAFSVRALVNFGTQAVQAADAADVANRRLENIAQSMGIFGDTTQQVTTRLKDYADQQMMVIGADDELIKGVQATLLTFSQLASSADDANGAFDRATKAAFDLAAAGFGSAETNAIQLGKALQDPIKGLTALRRSGISFTESEKERIKTLVEGNKIGEAQNLILQAIEKQVGGTAAATVTGLQRMNLAFGEMQETIGVALQPVANEFADTMQRELIPVVEELGRYLTSPQGSEAIRNFSDALMGAIGFLIDSAKWIGENWTMVSKLGTAVLVAVGSFQALKTALEVARVAQLVFNSAVLANPYVFAATAIALGIAAIWPVVEKLAGAFGNTATETDKASTAVYNLNNADLSRLDGRLFQLESRARALAAAANGTINPGNVNDRDMKPVNPKPGEKYTWYNYSGPNGQAVWWEQTWTGTEWTKPKKVTYNPPSTKKNEPAKETAAERFKKVQAVIKKAQDAILKAEQDYARDRFVITRDSEDRVAELRKTAAERQAEIVKQSMSRLTDAFRSATQISLDDLFDVTKTKEIETSVKQLSSTLSVSVSREVEKSSYSSVDSIVAGLSKRLEQSKMLIQRASQLSADGFSQTFIEQVIETGAETGNELASAILSASPETRAQMRTLFNELETVSETGMDAVAKQITEKFGLATRELKLQSAIVQAELDDALIAEQKRLTTALADAAYAFGIAMGDIKKTFLDDLGDFDGWFAGLKGTIDSLLDKMKELQGKAVTDVQAAITAPGSGTILEKAVVTQDVAVKNIRNATGIVIDSAADVAGTVAYLQARIKAAQNYIKSADTNATQDAGAQVKLESFQKELATLQGKAATGQAAGTTININVKTDSAQSQAMVGKTIGNIVTKYVTTGGQVLVSGNN
jgi:hypothetical protein